LLNHGFVTLAERGSENVNCFFGGDPKICLGAIAAIDAAAGKSPMWIVCRSKTTRCERNYREDGRLEQSVREGDLMLSHE
jgi:hypothetical protein